MNPYHTLAKPLLFRLDPEKAHDLAMAALVAACEIPLSLAALGRPVRKAPLRLFGLDFPNRVGLAAGFDKNAVALPAWERFGFGFVEAGTITRHAQEGNPKPRLFRYPDLEAVVNRFGFNNEGAEAVAKRLNRLRALGRWPSVPVGINIGKSKITPIEDAPADYVFSLKTLAAFADYFVLNVSSPNTPGLRSLQGADALKQLLGAVMDANATLPHAKPVLLKIAPDLELPALDEIAKLASQFALSGLIATNTTLDHSALPPDQDQQGGLSGAPLANRSLDILKALRQRSPLPIIAVGGIDSAKAANERLQAGASLVQIYTGMVYHGPWLAAKIAKGISAKPA